MRLRAARRRLRPREAAAGPSPRKPRVWTLARRPDDQVDEQLRIALHALAVRSPLLQLERARIGQGAQAPGADQRFVDPAEAPAIGRVDRRPEGHGLAV